MPEWVLAGGTAGVLSAMTFGLMAWATAPARPDPGAHRETRDSPAPPPQWYATGEIPRITGDPDGASRLFSTPGPRPVPMRAELEDTSTRLARHSLEDARERTARIDPRRISADKIKRSLRPDWREE